MAVIIQQLAIASSAVPTDASTLEASIWALKNSISALESSLKTLEGSSDRWETLAWSCAIAVGIGIVGETVVIISEYRDDLHDWRRGAISWVWERVWPPDRPPQWRFWFDIVATILVLIGVFGEAGASMKLASVNSQLRSKTSELRAKSDQLLALITLEAGAAKDSAEAAARAAKIAREEADKLLLEVMKQGPRSRPLRGHRDDLIKQLHPFAGQRFTLLEEVWKDTEATSALVSIMSALDGAGWTNNLPMYFSPPNTSGEGVIIRILPNASEETRRSAKALFSALSDVLLTGVRFADNGDQMRSNNILPSSIRFDKLTVLVEVGEHPIPR
jgi:hypothetical protein